MKVISKLDYRELELAFVFELGSRCLVRNSTAALCQACALFTPTRPATTLIISKRFRLEMLSHRVQATVYHTENVIFIERAHISYPTAHTDSKHRRIRPTQYQCLSSHCSFLHHRRTRKPRAAKELFYVENIIHVCVSSALQSPENHPSGWIGEI